MNHLCTYTCIDSAIEEHPLSSFSVNNRRLNHLFGNTKTYISLLIIGLFSITALTGQTDFYTQDFVKLTDLNEIKSFVSDMKENCTSDRYRINKTPVVEYYDKETKEFRGMSLNSEMVSFDKINVIKKDKNLKKFIKVHGLQLGSALYFKKPFDGMTQGQLKLIAGEPDNIKYAIDGESQVIRFKYANGKVYSFKDGKLLPRIAEVSKTPIAAKQP